MLRITKIEEVKDERVKRHPIKKTSQYKINREISQESFKNLINSEDVRRYSGYSKSIVTLLRHIREEFEEEVRIGTFHDINDYIEYFIERCRES